jgi:EAL domain-containing protein (putative c-di-GMP-specific phosphodiesterase class I)
VVLNAVRDIGIDYAQGYLQHRPKPWAAVMEPLMFKLAQLA